MSKQQKKTKATKTTTSAPTPQPAGPKKLLTARTIASRLKQPEWRVRHAIRNLQLKHSAEAGNVKVYQEFDVGQIEMECDTISSKARRKRRRNGQ